MADEEVKKRKRGSRGGSNTALVHPGDVEPQEQINEEKKKKTRRSQKGKTTANFVDVVVENEIAFTAGRTEMNEKVELDPETRSYFQEIEKKLTSLDTDFETVDDQMLFIANVFNEVDENLLMLCCDFETSRILERLLKVSSDFQVRVFADRLNGSYETLYCDQFASHVCQTLLNLAADGIDRNLRGIKSVEVAEELPSMEVIVLGIVDQLEGKWGHFMEHSHASHVFRTTLNVLSGQRLAQDSELRSKKSAIYNSNHDNHMEIGKKGRLVPISFSNKLKELAIVVAADLTDIQTLSFNQIANPVLQLLVSIQESKESIIERLLACGPSFIENLIRDRAGSHLMEKIIEHSTPSLYKTLYKDFFRKRLLELCMHPVANFVVQRLVQFCHKERHFKEMLEVLVPSFEDFVWGTGSRAGIVVKVVESCKKYPELQKTCVDSILGVFHATEVSRQSEIANLILNMRTYESYQERVFVNRPNMNGSLLLQHLLAFSPEQCKLFVDGITGMTKEQLQLWIGDPIASHVLEGLLSSTMASNKSKRALVEVFRGSFVALALDKYGSHFVDKCWLACNLELKTIIAQELADQHTKLSANFHAKFILRNCGIELFRRRKDEWTNHQKGIKREKKEAKNGLKNEIDDLFAKKGR